jgi:hypothetical protein
VENGSWHIYAMHSVLPLEPVVTHEKEKHQDRSYDLEVIASTLYKYEIEHLIRHTRIIQYLLNATRPIT